MKYRTKAGYSLIEILVASSILVVLMGIMVPNMQSSRAHRGLQDAASQCLSLLSFAHQAAVAAGGVAMPGTGQIVPPLYVSLSNSPLSCVIADGNHVVLKRFDDPSGVQVTVRRSAGTILPLPLTLVLGPNGVVSHYGSPAGPIPPASDSPLTATFSLSSLPVQTATIDLISGGMFLNS